MPTITIRNGNRSLKFTKRESDTLLHAKQICDDLIRDYPSARAEDASEGLAGILETYCTTTKPPTQAAK